MNNSGLPELTTIPDGKLAIVPLDSMYEFGAQIDKYIAEWRADRMKTNPSLAALGDAYGKPSYIVPAKTPRFGSGEAKGTVEATVRGDDVYILVDVCNYSITYKMSGYTNVNSPDDHFQDLKRVIAAVSGAAKRVNVIMPFLYEGRVAMREGRASLDCAEALLELEALGVSTIITFDAHDGARIQNAIPLRSFESFTCVYQFIKNILRSDPDVVVDRDHLMVISPDEGGMRRAIYMATVLGVDMGTFYVKNSGGNTIPQNEFLGSSVEGKDVILIDDMISSGETILATAAELKARGVGKVVICATFGMFTRGLADFDAAYERGLFQKMITTNLVYQEPEIMTREYYISCDMRKFVALIIDTLNHDCSISKLLDPIDRINKIVEKHRRHETF